MRLSFRDILVIAHTGILAICLFVVPAAVVAGTLGAAYGSVVGPDGAWWGAVLCSSFAATVVSAGLALSALTH